MKYWPGTKIVKSVDNVFNWREAPSEVSSMKDYKASINAAINSRKQKSRANIVFSKAHAHR